MNLIGAKRIRAALVSLPAFQCLLFHSCRTLCFTTYFCVAIVVASPAGAYQNFYEPQEGDLA